MTEALGMITVPFIPYPLTGGNMMKNSDTAKPLSWFRPGSSVSISCSSSYTLCVFKNQEKRNIPFITTVLL